MVKANYSKDRQNTKWIKRGIVILLLLFFFGKLIMGIHSLSFTYDEPIYIGVGYSDWLTRDMTWHEHIGHPPLINLLTAWPLLLKPGLFNPRTLAQFGGSDVLGFARDLLPHLGSLERTMFVTRVPIVWVTVLFATLAYHWSRRLWRSFPAGVLTLLLFILDPTITAHGRINSTDMGLAVFGFLTAYSLSKYLKTPSIKVSIAVGLSAGLALSAKASGPYFLGIAGLLLFAWSLLVWQKTSCLIRRMVLSGISWVVLSLLVLWACYFFEIQPVTPGGIAIPAASHWKGLSYINSYMQTGQVTYFRNKLYSENHPWLYFPVAFLIKTPVPILLVFIVAVVYTIRGLLFNNETQPISDIFVLICVPLGYFIFAMVSALQIGQRHLLPLYPFIFVLCGRVARSHNLVRRTPLWKSIRIGGGFVLLFALTFSSIKIFPYELSYFNVLAGGTEHGHNILADSSSDWGQAFYAVKEYTETHPDEGYSLAAFSSVDPVLYDLTYTPLPPTLNAPVTLSRPFNPEPGTYLISSVPLHGIWLLDSDSYSWFRYREPDDILAHAILVYHVSNSSPQPTWVAQCIDNGFPQVLSEEQAAQGFGIDTLRIAMVNCEQSWIYPQGSGWYVLPGEGMESSWAHTRLEKSELTYTQSEHWSHPALRIFLHLASMIPSPQQMLSADFSGPLAFKGYDLSTAEAKPGDVIELNTFWEVEALASRPLSLMAHLSALDGKVMQVGDGLGVPIEYWQVKDTLVQRHIFPITNDIPSGTYHFIVGAYWLDTMDRWGIPGADIDTISTVKIHIIP